MAVFDPRLIGLCLLVWFSAIAVYVREFAMLEILVVIVVLGSVALFAAVRYTAKPTDLSEDV